MDSKLIPEIELELHEYVNSLRLIDTTPTPQVKISLYHEDIIRINYLINNLKIFTPKHIKNILEKFKETLLGQRDNLHAIKIDRLVSRIGV